jgi:hypothetical protein
MYSIKNRNKSSFKDYLFKLLLRTIAKNKKLKKKASFPIINVITAPIKQARIIDLNPICHFFVSSRVIRARKLPSGKPKIKTPIPIRIL